MSDFTPAEIVLSEADYLDEAITNNQLPDHPSRETAEFARGWAAAAKWVRWHGNHEHLIIGRLEKKRKESEDAPSV